MPTPRSKSPAKPKKAAAAKTAKPKATTPKPPVKTVKVAGAVIGVPNTRVTNPLITKNINAIKKARGK